MNALISRLGSAVTGVLHGFDRLRFAGTQRLLANAAGLGAYLGHVGVLLKDFGAWTAGVTAEIRRASEAVMRDAGRPLQYLNDSSLSKEQLADAIRVRERIEAGPVCLLSAVASAVSSAERNRSGVMRSIGTVRASIWSCSRGCASVCTCTTTGWTSRWA